MRGILEILHRYKTYNQLNFSIDIFNIRQKGEVPDLNYHIYISSGGPGSPYEGEGEQWENHFFNGLTEETYFDLLKKVIVGKHQAHEVVLMDIDALNQKTVIDFYITARKIGIKVLPLEDIKREGKKLFYLQDDKKIQIKRIYNRLIFDEIANNTTVFDKSFDPREELDIEWITHPNWFYRISKYTMPFLKSKFVPETQFLDKIKNIPPDLENYVLKP